MENCPVSLITFVATDRKNVLLVGIYLFIYTTFIMTMKKLKKDWHDEGQQLEQFCLGMNYKTKWYIIALYHHIWP